MASLWARVLLCGAIAAGTAIAPGVANAAPEGRCVTGNWSVVREDVQGDGVANGQPFRSEAHGATGVLARIGPASVDLDFRQAADELHSTVGQPANSDVDYSGRTSARAIVTGNTSGRITMRTDTVTGDGQAVKTYYDPPSSFGWNVQDTVRSGGADGNFQGLIPVKATYRCSGRTLVIMSEGGGTDQDGQGGQWRVRSTVTYQRV